MTCPVPPCVSRHQSAIIAAKAPVIAATPSPSAKGGSVGGPSGKPLMWA